jgi:UDP-galactopyranose mutase
MRSSVKNDPEVIVVGAGISGCVMAERYASTVGKRVLVVEKRAHIGGNCYDFVDAALSTCILYRRLAARGV